MVKKTVYPVIAILLLLAMMLSGCGKSAETQGNSAEPANPSEPANNKPAESKSVSLALLKFTSNAPLFIAYEKGFFKDEHLDVELKWFDSANAVNVAVASSSVDIAAAGLTADFYNMIAQGQKMFLVADKGREEKGYAYSALVLPNDSPYKSVEELKGKKAAITTIGSTNHYSIARILENHGMSSKDVQWTPMNSVSGVVDAIKGKRVDFGFISEPNVTKAVDEGFGKTLTWISDEIKFQSSALVFSSKFISDRDASVRFLKAYLKGLRYYYDAALTKKDGKLAQGPNFDEVLKIITKYTGQPEDVIKKSFPFIDRNGKPDIDDLKEQIAWYAKEKLIVKTLEVDDFVDTTLLDEALKAAGN
ncbi:ABC transporter substrate-binding protein [Paenibacillus sp. JMULE4]|uniref:ABC transporter substrate-binding protein n=1 Tax=Paenibacillus sp. JMULE4 TaxID=2518342 RepID=UPI001C2DEFDA|nr:ABC transporter substrate-binding protein [Paenibacillus sp. JMULE4]